MISLAIAVKDPATSRRYRHMMIQVGYEAHYATTVDELARVVKSRPIDVVVFDLGASSLPASTWMSIVGKDNDLALTPVLWIGDNIAQSLRGEIQDHRPGLWLKSMPEADQFAASVLQLIGRHVDTGSIPIISPPPDTRKWTPQDALIDSALQIFEEEGGGGHGIPSRPDFEVQITHTGAHTQRKDVPQSPAPPAGANLEADDELEVAVSEVTTMPGATGPKRTIYTGKDQRPPTVVQIDLDEAQVNGSEAQMIDEIVDQVTERLASKLAKQVDAQMIRREIAVVMRERKG